MRRRVAQIPPSPVPSDAPAEVGPGVSPVLAQLGLKRAELGRGLMERAMFMGGPGQDGRSKIRRGPTWECGVARADGLEGVGIRVADPTQAEFIGKSNHAAMPRPTKSGRIEGLDPVRAEARLVGQQAAQDEPLGT